MKGENKVSYECGVKGTSSMYPKKGEFFLVFQIDVEDLFIDREEAKMFVKSYIEQSLDNKKSEMHHFFNEKLFNKFKCSKEDVEKLELNALCGLDKNRVPNGGVKRFKKFH